MKLLYSLCRSRLLPALLLLLTGIQTNAQTLTAKPNVYLTSNCNGYYEYLPVGYNPSGSQTYPVLIAFGGLSQNGNGTSAQLDYVFSNWGGPGWQIQNGKFPSSLTVNGQLFRFIVILPQFSSNASPKGVDDVISYIIGHYKADASRIYLTGNSSGGGYCWDYPGSSVQYGQRVAAIVPTCAASSFTTAKANNIAAANLPVWATHNAVDQIVSPNTTINFVNGINAAPTPPNPLAKKTIFKDIGHNCADSTFNMTYGIGAYAWMLQYKRGGAPPPNQPPVANAGSDVTITLPTNSVQLNGNGSYDPDGSISTYSWAKIAGPTQFTISNSNIVNPVFSNLVAGTYTLQLTVTDNKGAKTTDNINIVVNPAAANQPPVANAGSDVTITLPTNSVQLNGNGSYDPDGSISTYSWAKIAGPTQFTISNSNIVNPVFSNLVAGTYTLQLTVTDNKGAKTTDNINIVVKASAANLPPVVDAGPDIILYLPTNSVTLTGTASDADGTINLYIWTQVLGPSTSTISSPNTLQTAVGNLVQGRYVFKLTVQDDDGAVSVSQMQLTVKAATGGAPAKYVNVNIYGGSNPYNNATWNNWNVGQGGGSNITSSLFKYSDGSSSSVKAVLSNTVTLGDNLSTYSGGMAPPEVLRYTSYSNLSRTLTLSGLSTSLQYSIELYASRYSTFYSTKFTVNGSSVTIATHQNFTNKAAFSNITPNAQGQIIVSIQSITGWNYLNGFMLTEQSNNAGAPSNFTSGISGSSNVTAREPDNEKGISSVEVFPNPVTDKVVMQVNNSVPGNMKVQVINANGAIEKQLMLKHAAPVSRIDIPMGKLPAGAYIIKVQIGNWSVSKKIIKQ